MADETEISWCDSTMNFWWGCTAIAPACDHCYAEAFSKRTGKDLWGNVPRGITSPQNWYNPIRWQKKAEEFYAQHGRRRRVFVSSMSDFYDNQVDPSWRADAWEVIRQCPDIDWLILTKRPQNIRGMLPPFWDEIKDRIWSGTTVEDMKRARQNIPHILRIDSRYRFISAEPLLGPLYLRCILMGDIPAGDKDVPLYLDALEGVRYTLSPIDGMRAIVSRTRKLDWVIAGGESGHHARPMHISWPEMLQMDCADTGTAFHFKQWGNHLPAFDPLVVTTATEPKAILVQPWAHTEDGPQKDVGYPPPMPMVRVNYKVAGTLRGKDYKEFPNG